MVAGGLGWGAGPSSVVVGWGAGKGLAELGAGLESPSKVG